MARKLMLVILDGFGYTKNVKGNAVLAAKTPFLDEFMAKHPKALLDTCGLDVGLPDGIMGNSEVGHLNIGAGRIVYQQNTLIDKKIKEGEFFNNPAFLKAIAHARKNNGKIHLFGLLSDGGVHSSLIHLEALLKLFRQENFSDVYYHAFTDGRDTSPTAGLNFMKWFLQKAKEYGVGKVASVMGRYYAMDRDNRWERIRKAYEALVNGKGNQFADPLSVFTASYADGITDEFILPSIIIENGKPIAQIEDNDAIIFFNFRADRTREITRTFIMNDFNEFATRNFSNLLFVGMTEYDIRFTDLAETAFPPISLKNILGEVIAEKGLTQFRTAETEKYAHVTFFFNGGVEAPFKNEDRQLVSSPKVASYDLQPEMSAYAVTEVLLNAINKKNYDYITVNYANCDMVGHTGVFSAAVKAVETVDECAGKVINAALAKGYHVVLTADHGNAEKMLDEAGNVFTAHSMNPVYMTIAHADGAELKLKNGRLADVAPTILKLMEIDIPADMTGSCLID